MTVGQVSFKFLPLLLLFYMNYPPITCQNCGLPRVIRVSNQVAESLDTGQSILPPIPVQNVAWVRVLENPGNFVRVIFNPETESSCAQLSLEVNTPLWNKTNLEVNSTLDRHSRISFIDEHRLKELCIVLELECSDGREKNVSIEIPITDQNTAMPFYEEETYELTTEPCLQDRCVLTFAQEIKVIDRDVDEDNACLYMWTNVPHSVNFLHGYSNLEPYYKENEYGFLEPKGYQLRVKLEYVPEDKTKFPKDLNFTIFANNTVAPAGDFVFVAIANVKINFEENPHRLLAPVFTHPIYYAHVEYDGQQVYTEPGNIYATVPGQEQANNSDIQYVIQGEPNIFRIDGNGDLSFIKDVGVRNVLGVSESKRVDYNVTAIRKRSTGEGMMHTNASVPLVVFFDHKCPVTTTTLSPTTTPPDCSCESSSHIPLPGLCPGPTCPDPDPCSCPTTTEKLSTEPATTEHTPTDASSVEPTITSPFTTEPTTPSSSTTPLIPTRPPSECSCDCSDFSCENPQVEPTPLNSTHYKLYPDPYSCTRYYRCSINMDGPEGSEKETFECPQPDTVFCPILSGCTSVELCINRTSGSFASRSIGTRGYGSGGGSGGSEEEDECRECECRGSMLPPAHPANGCTAENHDTLIPDPQFCDLYHQCSNFFDYTMKCGAGLTFCPGKGRCGYYDEEGCECESSKTFKQCDVCIMGEWPEFDIFNQRFI